MISRNGFASVNIIHEKSTYERAGDEWSQHEKGAKHFHVQTTGRQELFKFVLIKWDFVAKKISVRLIEWKNQFFGGLWMKAKTFCLQLRCCRWVAKVWMDESWQQMLLLSNFAKYCTGVHTPYRQASNSSIKTSLTDVEPKLPVAIYVPSHCLILTQVGIFDASRS